MSLGWMVAAAADRAAAEEIGAGFELQVFDPTAFADAEAGFAALTAAENVGVLLSAAAAQDETFVSLLREIGQRRSSAQLIIVDSESRHLFEFLLEKGWPVMWLDEARQRAALAAQRRAETQTPPTVQNEAHAQASPQEQAVEEAAPPEAGGALAAGQADEPGAEAAAEPMPAEREDIQASPEESKTIEEAPIEERAPEAPPPQPLAAPAPRPAARARANSFSDDRNSYWNVDAGAATAAPADATAFAPKKLRRGSPELVRVVIHQPSDLKDVIKAARKIDPSTQAAPQGMSIGDVAIGSAIGVALEVRGGSCDGALQRRDWKGAPIDFNFMVDADEGAKQAVFVARVFINDAQIGTIAFTRPISGPKKKAADVGDGARLKRFKRVFLSYSHKDREIVSLIASAYARAGVEHFWDRTSLKSGEDWSPRLRREIDRADLFHLCWSKSAATSQAVEKEAEHALTRRQRTKGKTPNITVQMLDGPPWAPHPKSLDSINFDDFVRAAIVGYARGAG